jgi:hypothetical protein
VKNPPKPSPERLRQIVLDSEPLLRQLWERRRKDSDIIILGDMRREENRDRARGWWHADAIRQAAREGSYLPYIQPIELLDSLLRDGPLAQQRAAKELSVFSLFGLVPLWVVTVAGHWATAWTPPESGLVFLDCALADPGNN